MKKAMKDIRVSEEYNNYDDIVDEIYHSHIENVTSECLRNLPTQ
jgi:hypothetical protein